jgi:hypothetical protein
MTRSITIMRCGFCKKPFSFELDAEAPSPEFRNMICIPCYDEEITAMKRDEEIYEYHCREANNE